MVKLSELPFGLHNDISNKDYHDDRTFVSSSGLKLMYKNPRAFYNTYVKNEVEAIASAPLDFGSYVHSLILEPEKTDSEFAIFEEGMRRGKKWDEFAEANKDKTILSATQKNDALQLLNSFKNTNVIYGDKDNEREVPISSFIQNGVAEQSLIMPHTDDRNEVTIPCKVRFDYRREYETFGSIFDIKTTSEHADDKEQVEKICASWGYDVSAALYVDMVTTFTNKPHDFYFIFLSKKNNGCSIFKASEQMLERGREKYSVGMRKLYEARRSGIYFRNIIEEIRSVDL